MKVEGLGYRQWQKRNTDAFKKLSKENQHNARHKGYFNVGWNKVKQSWHILQELIQPISLFNVKLENDDLIGAITHSILEAEQAKQVAKQGIHYLQKNYKKNTKLVKKVFNQYPLL